MSNFKIPVFFSDKCVAPKRDESLSPSMEKPLHAVRSWRERGFEIDVREPLPASRNDLYLAHNRFYVDDVLECRIPNGFGTTDREISESLPYTSGAMVSAALEALQNQRVACAPVSGFHHAGYDFGQGFCTFNGLMVATRIVIAKEPGLRVGILDYDAHYGNGTDNILARDYRQEEEFTHAMVEHLTFGAYMRGDDMRAKARDQVALIPRVLESWKKKGVGLVLYQAGADPHVDDPYGGFLTGLELEERDRLVFENCKKLELPVAFCLAGGYQEVPGATLYERMRPVLNIHDATMRICEEVYCR